jgi:Chitin binding Peritrophin-A domain
MFKILSLIVLVSLFARQAVEAFTCTEPGLVPDWDSPDCTTYHICIENNGQLESVLAVCPPELVFHWIVLGCVPRSLFDCPNLHTTTTVSTTTTSTTTTTSITTAPITPPPGEFLCPGAGNFPDEESLDCRTFFSCSGPGVPPVRQMCPGQATFNWVERRCMINNNAQCPANPPPFTCDGVGDFPDPYSEDCSYFFQCFVHWDGTIRHTRVSCPFNMAFDWITLTCRVRAVAECLATTPGPILTTTTTEAPTTTTSKQICTIKLSDF